MTGYDFIGDVHGCATQLRTLLAELGYREDGVYRHPERTAVFVGDLIDRGPEQLEVLQIVKAMVDAGTARIVSGNHEFNAVCFATRDPRTGQFLRPHTERNVSQHSAFLTQLTAEQQAHYLDWFTTLPLWLDLGGVRVVHACWHEESMDVVREVCGADRLSTVEHYVEASLHGSPLYDAVELLLKGPEISLVGLGHEPYLDHSGHRRFQARMRWWNGDARTQRDIVELRGMRTQAGEPYPPLPDDPVDPEVLSIVYTDTVPVVYGHYWFEWERHREDWTAHTACVDFSAVKGGKLVAYRWNGEPEIHWRNYLPHDPATVSPSGF